MFVSPLAGPSRVSYNTIFGTAVTKPCLRRISRRYASEASSSTSTGTDSSSSPQEKLGRPRAQGGYPRWLETEGEKYRKPIKGQKATWLGGHVPFPTNPSFRPPPPISNDLQSIIDVESRSQGVTIGVIAQRYNVSKARIEAIRKLKEVEREFSKQGLPLQRAYQEGMETLLGVRPIMNERTKMIDQGLKVKEEMDRREHPSSVAEAEEEQRWDAGIGQGGAFGDRRSLQEGVEIDVWEFRDEEGVLQKIAQADEKKKEDAIKKHHDEAELEVAADAAEARSASHVVKPISSKVPYRFIDTSATTKSKRKKHVAKK